MSLILSCVVDRAPKFLTQAVTLLTSLRAAGFVADAENRVLVHVVDQPADDPRFDPLRRLGAEIRPVAAFGEGPAAWSNKLRQLETPEIRAARRVILCDADLLVLADPRGFFDEAPVRAKIVDRANPPAPLLAQLWAAAGRALPPLVAPAFNDDERTHPLNCNGGLYLLQHGAADALAEAWPRWSRWCLAQAGLLGRFTLHADQLGFVLAMEELGLGFSPLGIAHNLTTNLPVEAYAGRAPVAPQIIHYHDRVAEDGLPRAIGVDWIDAPLTAATARLRAAGGGTANPHDIGPGALAWGLAATPTPELLTALVALSRDRLGFFPATVIRTLEYPWVAARLRHTGGARVLEVGSGVSVLPLWLAGIGASVTTCDPHPLHRDPADRSRWTEWGFLDYGALDPRITSINAPVEALEGAAPFDAACSVSVVEHLPAEVRRAAIARIAALLRPGGLLVLTVDLVPGSDALWPLSEGRVVDPDAPHGTRGDLEAELVAAGFALREVTLRRAIPGSRTDLALIEAVRA